MEGEDGYTESKGCGEAERGGRAPWGGCAPGIVNMQVAYF